MHNFSNLTRNNYVKCNIIMHCILLLFSVASIQKPKYKVPEPMNGRKVRISVISHLGSVFVRRTFGSCHVVVLIVPLHCVK